MLNPLVPKALSVESAKTRNTLLKEARGRGTQKSKNRGLGARSNFAHSEKLPRAWFLRFRAPQKLLGCAKLDRPFPRKNIFFRTRLDPILLRNP